MFKFIQLHSVALEFTQIRSVSLQFSLPLTDSVRFPKILSDVVGLAHTGPILKAQKGTWKGIRSHFIPDPT